MDYSIHVCVGIHDDAVLEIPPFAIGYVDEKPCRIFDLVPVSNQYVELGLRDPSYIYLAESFPVDLELDSRLQHRDAYVREFRNFLP